MLVDWLIYGLLVFGAAKLLNVTAFKQKHFDVYCECGRAIGPEGAQVSGHFR